MNGREHGKGHGCDKQIRACVREQSREGSKVRLESDDQRRACVQEERREGSTARGRTTVMSIVRHAFENQEHG
jgi:hypothetical protein